MIHGNMNIKFNVSEQYCWTSGAKSLFKHKYNKRALFFLYCKYIEGNNFQFSVWLSVVYSDL